MEKKPYKVYFAGDLFDQKHITGNHLLAQQIEKLSNGLYKCVLPQKWDGLTFDNSVDIRNKDIKSVIGADLVLFNFDGTDLDSGTVVEFVIAKMLDIPAVLLRTDLRNGGYFFDEDWNLMVEGYPRCVAVKFSAFDLYNSLGLEGTHKTIAQAIIDSFKNIAQEPPLLKSPKELLDAYQFVIKMCGGGLDATISKSLLHEIVHNRFYKKKGASTERFQQIFQL